MSISHKSLEKVNKNETPYRNSFVWGEMYNDTNTPIKKIVSLKAGVKQAFPRAIDQQDVP